MIVRGLTRAAVQQFNQARLQTQFALWGETVSYIAKTGATPIALQACLSPIRNNKDLRDGGFALLHDFMARIRMSQFPTAPREEGELQVDGCIYRIKEVIRHRASGEWKLGLSSATS